MSDNTERTEIEESRSEDLEIPARKSFSWWRFWLWSIFFLVVFTLFSTHWLILENQPPDGFPTQQPITVESGMTVREIADKFESAGAVRSATLLYFMLVFFHEPTEIKASTYIFNDLLTTDQVAKRLTEGDFASDLVKITHVEGERVSHLAKRVAEQLENFDPEQFVELAEPNEGKLFPETYHVPADFTATDFYQLLSETYQKEFYNIQSSHATTTLSEDEVLVLASIIEREANTPESMKMVSGILQNRLKIGMPMQADASIEYVLDKSLSELTPDDLKIDTPYNTYLYTGLPPTPIGNPGREAITAVFEPTPSDYYYYITDESGEFHYAKTYTEHQRNIAKYLR